MITVGITVVLFGQVLFMPTSVSLVNAGSTLTPTSAPVNTQVPTNTPAPTNTLAPAPTQTPSPPPPTNTPSSSGNSGGSTQDNNTPTPTPEPIIPQEIPSLGVGANVWQLLMIHIVIIFFGLLIAFFQVRKMMLESPTDQD